LPPNLSGVGYFVAHCFFDVGGGVFGNGIARLICQFYGGFNESSAKSPFALVGMPEYGKLPDSAQHCSNCRSEVTAGKKYFCCGTAVSCKYLRCCGKVGYCSKECQLADWRIGHKMSCERNTKTNEKVKASSDDNCGEGKNKVGM
jgi:hypothetical protein